MSLDKKVPENGSFFDFFGSGGCLYHISEMSIIITSFFTPALADGLSLETEWQQVSSSFQDSSQYSGQS